MQSSIAGQVEAIGAAMSDIVDAFTSAPSSEVLIPNIAALISLEKIFNTKILLDAAVARAAELANAGVLVGGGSHIDFLIRTFGLSRAEAFRRAELARELYPDPQPEDPGTPETEVPDDREEREAREKEEKEAREAREREAEEKRRQALKNSRENALSAEKLAIINRELSNLNRGTTPTRQELLAAATAEAADRSAEDLRRWVRTAVTKANKTTPDPFAAMRKRFLHIAGQDSDGGVRLTAYLPADAAAMLHAALAPLAKRGDLVDVLPDEDTRTMGQRRVDALSHILGLSNSGLLSRGRHGIGSIVVSMSVDDVTDLEPNGAGHRYPTNTGVRLTPFEILNLGAAKYDFGAVLDSHSGRPLHLGRTRRSASLEQRIALQAAELVCTHPGCSQPMINCEVHHLIPWSHGGRTDIGNLAGMCFGDHKNNDDSRTGRNNKGYMDTDPGTGRVGHYPADGSGVVFNETAAQSESGGARARTRARERSGTEPPQDYGGLFDVPA
ncbi:HNH endonuclease signature motif containing protein [Corynebacterium pacaense]|uniref:HNH endonuclease signature motif containing protein n=1 Tax=Corynebacterium pacaense TaxID=1816684 RepID=UPI0015C4CF14|nr:HNH endonuclease signature motif containing protein [Corynebacterium pacaense]